MSRLEALAAAVQAARRLASWSGHAPTCTRARDSVKCACGRLLSIACTCGAGAEQVDAIASFRHAEREIPVGQGAA